MSEYISFSNKDFESCTGVREDAQYLHSRFKQLFESLKSNDIFNRLESRHGPIGGFALYQIRSGQPMDFNELKRKTKDVIYSGTNKYCFFPLDVGLMSQAGALNIFTTGESYEHAKHIQDEVVKSIGYRK